MDTSTFDLDDEHDAVIANLIGLDARIIWRGDLPWHQGEDALERHIIGFTGGSVPGIFMASARNSWGSVHGHVYMLAPVESVCRPHNVGVGVQVNEPRVKGVFDRAIVVETATMGSIKYVGRSFTNASAVYLLRITPDFEGPERLAIAFARNEKEWDWPKAEVVWSMPFEEVIELAKPTNSPIPPV
jgi:hypothetical protein